MVGVLWVSVCRNSFHNHTFIWANPTVICIARRCATIVHTFQYIYSALRIQAGRSVVSTQSTAAGNGSLFICSLRSLSMGLFGSNALVAVWFLMSIKIALPYLFIKQYHVDN